MCPAGIMSWLLDRELGHLKRGVQGVDTQARRAWRCAQRPINCGQMFRAKRSGQERLNLRHERARSETSTAMMQNSASRTSGSHATDGLKSIQRMMRAGGWTDANWQLV